ncbi:MAG: hypothetical protein IIC28_12070 [Chloroflexi bacterium]|nr:hypothetical protein [Chloroflexota bacterium]
MTTREKLVFEAPGPGTWVLDNQHFPNPLSRFKRGLGSESSNPSMNMTRARYGALTSVSSVSIHGFNYARRDRVGVPPGSSEAQTVDNPVVAERVERARQVVVNKLWQKDLERWDNEIKPDSIERNLKLARIEVDALDHRGLAEHLYRCRSNMAEMQFRHHMFTNVSGYPAALFILNVSEWTGLDPGDLHQLLDGSSRLSSGATEQFEAVVDAIRSDEESTAILNSGDDAQSILRELLDIPGTVGDAVDRFWLIDGHALATGFDLHSVCAYELPEILVDRIKDAVENGIPDRSIDALEAAEFIRLRVPAEHRETFDAELADARNIARLKDERGIYNDIWASGIMRKAILAAGRQLVEDGLLSDSENLIEADWAEMQSLLRGVMSVSDAELADRRVERMSLTWRDAPARLGPPPTTPPPIEGLPPEVERLYKALEIVEKSIRPPAMSEDAPDLTGTAASKGSYEGRARVAVGDYRFDQIDQGDVLVTSTHSEAFSAVAGRVGAIVTDTGGILSHLSIVARELGIPCVVACKNATTVIPEGALVRVDGNSGEVTILG